MSKLPRITGSDMVNFLKKRGFRLVRIRGSHHVLKNNSGKIVVVPVHPGETLGVGITKKILSHAGISVEEFKDEFS